MVYLNRMSARRTITIGAFSGCVVDDGGRLQQLAAPIGRSTQFGYTGLILARFPRFLFSAFRWFRSRGHGVGDFLAPRLTRNVFCHTILCITRMRMFTSKVLARPKSDHTNY